ncbi:MAG TPA: hypothetical protein VFW00_12030 [Rhodocyclaceae bacterium]|nr:hypothetical protein [Rhodocyclaceae bacterium]
MDTRIRQASIALECEAQPTLQAKLLRDALRKLEEAYGKDFRNPRIILTADEQHALDQLLGKARRQFDNPPHRAVQLSHLELYGIRVYFWYGKDGHLWLMSSDGRRPLLSSLDAWA